MKRCEAFLAHLHSSPRLISGAELLSKDCPVPTEDGIYGCFVDDIVPGIDTTRCLCVDGRVLLYIGAGRGRPSSNRPDRLRGRLKEHFSATAEGSTLRYSLGTLLSDEIGLELRLVGKDTKVFANGGEGRLDEWMRRHVHFAWLSVEAPWEVEKLMFSTELYLPLNIDGKRGRGSFLKAAREAALARAKALPVLQGDRGR